MKKSGRKLVALMAILAAALLVCSPAKADMLGDQYWDHVDWFTIHVNEDGVLNQTTSDGSGLEVNGENWIYYPGDQGNGYWTQWFYDGRFDQNRYKQVYVEFAVHGYPEGAQFVNSMEMSLNWTTPQWSELEMGRPPMPSDFYSPTHLISESTYIGRSDVLLTLTEYDVQSQTAFFTFDYTIPRDFGNPEWVSIDFRGNSFGIGSAVGTIAHSCLPVPEPGTLTLLGLGLAGIIARKRLHL